MKLGVIGTVFVDIKGYPLGEFIPNGRNAGKILQFHGGVGRNIAEDVAAIGEQATFISLVDESGIGMGVKKHLQEQGVQTDYLKATPDGMGAWLAVFDGQGEVYGNISQRANMLPICDVLREQGDEIFAQLDSLLLEIDMDEPVVAEVFRLATKHQVPVYGVISNMTIALERLAYVRQTACFVCNKQEAGQLFAQDTEQMKPQRMLELIQAKQGALGLKCLVVTMDAEGAVFSELGGEMGHCPAQPVQVVDTTGAGDSFFAGTTVGLTRGYSLEQACQLGVKVASQVIAGQGNVYTGAKLV